MFVKNLITTGGNAVSTPISNNSASNQSTVIANRQAARSENGGDDANVNAAPAVENRSNSSNDDSVHLSRAGELLNQAHTSRAQSEVSSPEHAKALAQQLKVQIESNPAQALEGLSNGISKDLLDLLKTT